jgi:hypothetical protein
VSLNTARSIFLLSEEEAGSPNDLPGFVALLSESLMTIWLSITILMVNVVK